MKMPARSDLLGEAVLQEIIKSNPEFLKEIKDQITTKLVDAVIDTDLIANISEVVERNHKSLIDDLYVKVDSLNNTVQYIISKIERIEDDLGIRYESLKRYGLNVREQLNDIRTELDVLHYHTFNINNE